MGKIKISNLDMLEQDVWFNFCYNYQFDVVDIVKDTDSQAYKDNIEKIILSLQTKDFELNEQITYLAELMGETVSVPFKPFQIAELLKQIHALRQGMNHIAAHLFQRQYSDILIAYVDTLGTLDSIENRKLARSVKAMLAVKARYEKHLYPRREILYRILREQVVQRGKWDNLNQAVNFVLDDLIKAFDAYDIQWVKSELVLKQEMLDKLEWRKQPAKQANVELKCIRRKITTASKAKKIEKLQMELKNLNQILKAKYPSKEMEKFGYKMPYSGGYMAETIIHELRNQPELLREILF